MDANKRFQKSFDTERNHDSINSSHTAKSTTTESMSALGGGARWSDGVGPYDVVCGRGAQSYNNCGNRRFRVFISMNVERYVQSSQGRGKRKIIGSLVDTLLSEIGAKFYKIKSNQGPEPSALELVEMTVREIRQKVGHALRDLAAFKEKHQQKKMIRKNSVK